MFTTKTRNVSAAEHLKCILTESVIDMEKRTVNILGTEYTIEHRKEADDPKLADGIAVQQGGSEVTAAYTSTIGYIAGAEFGTYTLLVYCPSNITNGYLSGRYSYKQLEYGAGNYQYEDKCLFVWEDMSTKGGFYSWVTP